MKTFETEKHNIPEGATHYMNQTSYTYFAWGKFVGEKLHLMLTSESEWTSVCAGMFDNLKPIPQTNIETPEEKEALDLIDTTPHQYEMSKFKSNPVIQLSIDEIDKFSGNKPRTKVEYEKWNFECAWHAIKAFEDGEKLYTKRSHKDFILIDNAQDVIRFLYSIYERIEYDETPQQREERERLEAAYDLYEEGCKAEGGEYDSFDSWSENKYAVVHFLAIVDKTNYRKESN